MEVKAKENMEVTDELKSDANVKDTDRKQQNEKLQTVLERKLQQLRYNTIQTHTFYIITFRLINILKHCTYTYI